MPPDQSLWLGKLANLNAARTEVRGIAPHKPLMLLTVIDLIESGDIPDGWVKYDARLVSRFRDYWELVLERQRNQPDIPMPFHALGGARDRVWQTFTASGEPSEAKATTDWWDGHVAKEVGSGYGRLLQSYGVHKTVREAATRGLRHTRRIEADGTVLLTLEGGSL